VRPGTRVLNLGDLRRVAYQSRRGRRGVGDAGTCVDPDSGLPIDCATGIMLPGFTDLTAAQQAAFEAGAQPGQAFSTMTAAQQAAYLAANTTTAPATTSALSLSSLPSWALPVGIGVLALVLFSSMKGGR
jgi:hypothetical protein